MPVGSNSISSVGGDAAGTAGAGEAGGGETAKGLTVGTGICLKEVMSVQWESEDTLLQSYGFGN